MKKFKSIKAQTILYLLIIILCIQITTHVVNYYQSKEIIGESIEKEAKVIISPMYDSMDERLQNLGNFEQKKNFVLNIYIDLKANLDFTFMLKESKHLKNIQFVNKEGTIVAGLIGKGEKVDRHLIGLTDKKEVTSTLHKNLFSVFVPYEIDNKVIGGTFLHYDKKLFKEEMEKTLISTLIILIIFLFMGVTSTSLMLNKITNPISNLVSASNKMANGDLNTPIKIKSNNEIGVLANSFESMRISIKNQEKKLKIYSKDLEKKVDERAMELNKKIIELNDTKTAILNMMEDTDQTNSELINTQRDLKESMKKLKVADTKKDEFISIAAHELKTPLTSIRGFASLLRDPKITKDTEKRDKYFQIIEKDTERLGRLITDIMDLSRFDLGSLKLNIEKIDTNELVTELKEQMDIIMSEKGIKSVYDVSKNLPTLKIDKGRVIQVLSNLINNSVKYTQQGGKITIKVHTSKDHVFFSVSDTGRGISKEDLPKVFERFYQSDSSYTRQVGGTGLGLSICKEFIEAMGGSISVTSTEGKGTTFLFNIPTKPSTNKDITN